MKCTTLWIMASPFWLVSTVKLLKWSELRLPYCSKLLIFLFIESYLEHKSLFSASSSKMISWLTFSCLPCSCIFSWCFGILIFCLLTRSCNFLLVSKIGYKMVVFKLLMTYATDDFVSWIRVAIISERSGAILLLHVLSFSDFFTLSEKVLGRSFILSLAVNLLISGSEFVFRLYCLQGMSLYAFYLVSID